MTVLALCVKAPSSIPSIREENDKKRDCLYVPLSEVPGTAREEKSGWFSPPGDLGSRKWDSSAWPNSGKLRLDGGGVAAQNGGCLKPYSWT